ncbi:ceramidase [Gongronella butleri]|nr:ceramidase [Gongronella butleri]
MSLAQKDYFWGPTTSTIDWCEENYALSPFIAEFVNTTTNTSFFLLSLFGIYNTISNGFNKSFIVAHLGVMFVGIGSWFFHMTLQYEMQLLDELPMIYVGCIMVWHSIEVYEKMRYGWSLVLFLIGYSVFVTYSYLIINDPVFHQVAYALLVFFIVFRSIYMVRQLPGGAKVNEYEYPRMVTLLRLAAASFLLAFGIWNVDNVFCSSLRHFRVISPFAVGLLSQCHGWWHLGTSIGVYYYVVYTQWLHQLMANNKQKHQLVWAGPLCYLKPVKSHKQ